MKIIYNKILPLGKNFYAMNLFGILFAKGPCDNVLINHERIHTAQQIETGFIFFYILYFIEWLIKIIKYRNSYTAYKNLSFEREAYENQKNLEYIGKRKIWSFLKYMRMRDQKFKTVK